MVDSASEVTVAEVKNPRGESRATDDADRIGVGLLSLADMIVLIFGTALALTPPWYNPWTQRPQPVMEPRWRVVALFLEEATGKAGLAFVPLMLYRRARLGGACRPGELLLVICAARVLVDQVDRASGLGIEPPGVIVAHPNYWACLAAASGASLAAFLALVLFRARLSPGVLTLLCSVAVAGSYPWPNAAIQVAVILFGDYWAIGDSSIADYALFIGSYAISNLTPAVIGVAACWDAARCQLHTGAIAGIGLVLAVINMVVCLGLYLPGHFAPTFPPWDDQQFYVLLAAPLSLSLLGCALFRTFGGSWRRCLDLNPTRQHGKLGNE